MVKRQSILCKRHIVNIFLTHTTRIHIVRNELYADELYKLFKWILNEVYILTYLLELAYKDLEHVCKEMVCPNQARFCERKVTSVTIQGIYKTMSIRQFQSILQKYISFAFWCIFIF